MGFTQKEVSDHIGVNEDTLRRMEKGETVPKIETLELLSVLYRHDLIQLLTECRTEDGDYWGSLLIRIERKMDEHFYSFHEELLELEEWIKHSHSLFERKKLLQLHYLLSGLDDDKDKKEPDVAIDLIVKGIRLTLPNFTLENYESFHYNSGELRLLLNIALIENMRDNREIYLRSTKFCFDRTPTSSPFFPKIAYNLALAYWRQRNYEEADRCLESALQSAMESRSFHGLPLMYYLKGLIQRRTDDENYRNSIKTSLFLCDIYGQSKLKERIYENMSGIRGLNLDDFKEISFS